MLMSECWSENKPQPRLLSAAEGILTAPVGHLQVGCSQRLLLDVHDQLNILTINAKNGPWDQLHNHQRVLVFSDCTKALQGKVCCLVRDSLLKILRKWARRTGPTVDETEKHDGVQESDATAAPGRDELKTPWLLLL